MSTLYMNQDMYIEVVQGVRVEALMAIAAAADAARAAATSAACNAGSAQGTQAATITAAGDATDAVKSTPDDVIDSPVNTQHMPNDEDRARVQAEANVNP